MADDFDSKMSALVEALASPTLDIIERIGFNVLKDIRLRIINEGIGADGNKLKPYSAKYLQFKTDVGRYKGVVDYQLGNYSINNRVKAVEERRQQRNETLRQFQELGGVKQSKKRKGLTDKQIKAEANKRRGKAIKNGSELWRNIMLIEKKGEGAILVVSFGAIDPENKKKLLGLSYGNGKGSWSGRGDVLGVTAKEQSDAVAKFNKEFGELISKVFK